MLVKNKQDTDGNNKTNTRIANKNINYLYMKAFPRKHSLYNYLHTTYTDP